MKKLLLISNPSVLGKNLENILKQNYHTDFISTVPKQIGSIPFNSYNALLLDFTLLHEYNVAPFLSYDLVITGNETITHKAICYTLISCFSTGWSVYIDFFFL